MSLNVYDLIKKYKAPDGTVVPVIDIPSLQLANGEQVSLVGGSGSGKTTLLHLIAGILAPDSGRIIFDEAGSTSAVSSAQAPNQRENHAPTDLSKLSEAARDAFRGRYIGYIFQTHHLLPGFTALENVLLGMSFTGRKPDSKWAVRLLNEVGLGDRLDYQPARLSVGQQQRVAVARALANRPRLVLADEPTGALDPNTAEQVLKLIRDLCHEVDASLLLVSHDLSIAHQFSRVLTLSELNRSAIAKAAPLEPARVG